LIGATEATGREAEPKFAKQAQCHKSVHVCPTWNTLADDSGRITGKTEAVRPNEEIGDEQNVIPRGPNDSSDHRQRSVGPVD
jgi:hypothetical protein